MQEPPPLELVLVHEDQDWKTAEVVGEVCRRTAALLFERWSVEPPDDVRVYLLDSWRRFVFDAAPWSSRLWLALSYPLWARRVETLWRSAGGWAQRFGRRHTVCVKPPRAYEDTDREPGRALFLDAPVEEKVRHVTCHELTHAFTDFLRLPPWLNEGVAMVAVDRLVGAPTVVPESLERLRANGAEETPEWKGSVREFASGGHAALIEIYARGYWVTRYLDEVRPDVLRYLLARRLEAGALEAKLADALGLGEELSWPELGELVVEHFAAPAEVASES